jgi:hypothetical protein
MASWNLVLQVQGVGTGPGSQCQRLSVPGMPRPCRVLFYACDNAAMPMAAAAYNALEGDLRACAGVTSAYCGGPGMWGCMTWSEPSCLQLLVPVISGPIMAPVAADLLKWQSRAGAMSAIVPALLSSIGHGAAFAGCPPSLSRVNIANWLGNPVRLAAAVMQRALQLDKPGLFVSYCRQDAAPLVDQLHDELVHRGFRVFLDRFSGTPGRYFPSELAEELADKATLLVIESTNILQSKWTLWEIGFAHRYQLGLIALQLPMAPNLRRITARLAINPTPGGTLNAADLDPALAFIDKEHVIASLRRRAFYEGLISGAASQAGGTLEDKGDGVLQLKKRSGVASAFVLPSGRPGQLADVRSLAVAATPGLPKLLLGQHRHLPPRAHGDLRWLAGEVKIDLLGRYDGYRSIQALC